VSKAPEDGRRGGLSGTFRSSRRLRYVGVFDMPAVLDLVEQMTDAAMSNRDATEE
jgi:hypothetical protein